MTSGHPKQDRSNGAQLSDIERLRGGSGSRDALHDSPRSGVEKAGWPRWALGLLLVALTFATYVPAMQCGFIWDDDSYVLENKTVQAPDGLSRIWLELGATTQYYPLVYSSYWIEHKLWGLEPGGYHAVNVALHALVALLFWRVLLLLNVPGAWLAAALFAVHPVHVQSVAWITQRKNVLSGVLCLWATLAYLHYAVPTRVRSAAGFSALYLAAMFLFLGALLSKTVTCILPAVLLLLLWWKRRRLGWDDVYSLAPFFVLGIAFGVLTILVETNQVRAVGPEWERPAVERLLVAGRAVWFYLGKLLWPVQLTFVYPRWGINSQDWQQYLYPAAAIALPGALWIGRGRLGKGPLVAALCFLAAIFPALGFFNIYYTRYSYVADQWQYLASLFAIALAVSVGTRIAGWLATAGRRAGAVLAVAAVAFLATVTWRYERAFYDLESIWQDTIKKNPGCWLAHNNLGNLYEKEARRLKSEEMHDDARSRLDDALRHHDLALSAGPGFDADKAMSHFNLANSLVAGERFDEAAEHYRESIKLRDDFAPAHINLANALLRTRSVDEAVTHYAKALEINPRDVLTHYNLALVLASAGQTSLAVPHLRAAIEIERDWLAPLTALAWMLAADADGNVRNPDEAILLADRAADLTDHSNAAVLDLLAASYASAGRFDEALSTGRDALELANTAQADRLAEVIQSRLDLYESGRPFIRPAAQTDSNAPADPQ